MTDTQRPVRDYPFSAPDRLHLDPFYAELRRTEPLTRVRMPFGEEVRLATRHADVRTVLGDPRFSRAASVGRDEPRITPRPIEGGMLSMDPPEHSRLRQLMVRDCQEPLPGLCGELCGGEGDVRWRDRVCTQLGN